MPARRKRFALYCSSAGNYFFAEIRQLLASGLREAGAAVQEADERAGFARGADWHVAIGPQEFFYLGRGNGLRTGPWPPGVILYNAEQAASGWFGLVRRLVPRAHAVWDMDLETSRSWARAGLRSAYLPLGWTAGCGLFEPVRELPRLAWTRGLGPAVLDCAAGRAAYAQRPLDILFAGSRVPRREKFFAKAVLPPGCRSLIRLSDDSRFLRPGRAAPLHTRALLGLAQRAKIVLNIHRQETRYFEWHRIVLHGIGQGALVLSEPTAPAPPFRAGHDFVEAPLREFPAALRFYIGTERGRAQAARIAAQGARTLRRSGSLSGFLSSALRQLGPSGAAALTPPRRRIEAALGLLRHTRRP